MVDRRRHRRRTPAALRLINGIASLPAGSYILAAVTDIAKDEQFDPALLNQVLNAGTPITLVPGERKVQDLVIK